MPLFNPRRMLTKFGKTLLLDSSAAAATDGWIKAMKVFAVLGVTINPVTDELTALVQPGFAMDGPYTPTWTGPTVTASSGKVYKASSVVTISPTSPTEDVPVIGVVLGLSATPAEVAAFLEFDDTVHLDETSELLRLCIEEGFDGQKYYVVPRLLPLGV